MSQEKYTSDQLATGMTWLHGAIGLKPEETVFPWQTRLLKRFLSGELPSCIDIPTGLGKTAVMAIWLVARALDAPVPRRLVYVVDRRAVVDQATELALKLRRYVDGTPPLKSNLGLGQRSLPISTLRGKYIDNREWLEDPASPAIVVGTVDMIGSRLLFEGYGVSRKLRPYQAGLLGADVLLVLDEAHLVPPFQRLIETIAGDSAAFGPRDSSVRGIVPSFRVLPLSATGRQSNDEAFELTEADFNHPEENKRLSAVKQVELQPLPNWKELPQKMADCAWAVTADGTEARRVVLFCHHPENAEAVSEQLRKLAAGKPKEGIPKKEIAAELLVGGRRIYERQLAADWLRDHQFLATSESKPTCPTFLVATSAGEVGVDLDADDMVSDLVEWERMVQRLGRVNRRGGREANIVVFHEVHSEPEALKKAEGRTPKEQRQVDDYEKKSKETRERLAPLQALPACDGRYDGSSGAIRDLKLKAREDAKLHAIVDAATTREPLYPTVTRALVDAWSMTSLKEHTGRPKIAPWLRGWVDDPPQTRVIWRRYLPTRSVGRRENKKEVAAFFEAAPPHLNEILETETYRVIEWLKAQAKAHSRATADGEETKSESEIEGNPPLRPDSVVAFVLESDGDFIESIRLRELNVDAMEEKEKKRQMEKLEDLLLESTLVVDARLGGCKDGRLSKSKAIEVCKETGDGPWPDEDGETPSIGFRIRVISNISALTVPTPGWYSRYRFATALSEDGEEAEWLLIEKGKDDAANEEDRSAGEPQLLEKHRSKTETQVKAIARALALPDEYRDMLSIAARLHDEGKGSQRWQRAFRAPGGGIYAKTRGPINFALLDGYRHELGSLRFAEHDKELLKLTTDLQDLALHVIAAHHGFARPVIGVRGCDDAPPSALEDLARGVALRFARLQKRWGPWGLGWWESLLRAADQQASRENRTAGSRVNTGGD